MTTIEESLLSASEVRVVLGQLVRRLRAERGFPIGHAAVLVRLERDGPQTTSDLAAQEHVRPQSMAQTIAELHSTGLIGRRPDKFDGRRVLIELTSVGRRQLRNDRARRDDWLAQAIEEKLTRTEQRALARAVPLLRRLADS